MQNNEIRMTKEISNRKDEVQSGDRSGSSFGIRHSSFLRISSFGLRYFFALTTCISLAQQPAPLPDEEDLPAPDDSWDFTSRPGISASLRAMLDKLVPEGRSHEGLRYPIYSDGKTEGAPEQEGEFQSGRMSRLDETWVQFEKAQFQSFGDPAAPDTATRTILLEDAIYDIRHDLLFTDTAVTVEDKAGSIHSGAMLYDRATGLTVFSGGVELYLYDEPEAAAPATPAPASAPVPENPTPKPGTP